MILGVSLINTGPRAKKNKGSYDLYSKGPDKVDGNEDDIGNWDAPAAPAK